MTIRHALALVLALAAAAPAGAKGCSSPSRGHAYGRDRARDCRDDRRCDRDRRRDDRSCGGDRGRSDWGWQRGDHDRSWRDRDDRDRTSCDRDDLERCDHRSSFRRRGDLDFIRFVTRSAEGRHWRDYECGCRETWSPGRYDARGRDSAWIPGHYVRERSCREHSR